MRRIGIQVYTVQYSMFNFVVADQNRREPVERAFYSTLSLFEVSAAVANTSTLLSAVGSPPWGLNLSGSGLVGQLCSAVRRGTGGSALEYVLPSSLLRVGRVETDAFSERVVAYNASALHVLPTTANLLTNLRLRELLGGDTTLNVSAALHPLSFSSASTLISSRQSSLMSISMFVVFAAVPALVILMFTAGEIAGDRGLGVMQVLRLSGVRFKHFWSARLALDCPQYLLVILLFCVVLQTPLIPVCCFASTDSSSPHLTSLHFTNPIRAG